MGESKSGLGHLQAWCVVLRLPIVRYTDGGGGGFRGGICLVPGTVSTDGAGGANNGYSLGLGSVEGHLFYT